jgi:O-antigen/teichoic acid export membrane protein
MPPDPSHHHELRRAARETFLYAFSKVVPAVATFAGIRVFTAWYTPEEYGRFASLLALAMMVASLGSGWLQMAVLRLFPEWEKGGALRDFVRSTWAGYLVAVVFGGGVCLLAWVLRDTQLGLSMRFNSAGSVFILYASTAWFLVGTTLLRAYRLPGLYSLAQSLSSLLRVLGGVALTLFFGAAVSSLVGGTVLAMVLSGALVLFVLRVKDPAPSPLTPCKADREGREWKALWALFAFGFPLSIGQFSSQVLNVSDRYLISVLRGDQEAGLYAVNYDIADYLVRMVILTLMLSAYTAVTECYEKSGRKSAEQLVSSLSRIYLMLAAPAVVACAFVQRDLVAFLADSRFREGADILVWIALGDLFLGLSQYQQFGFHLGRRPLLLSLTTLLAAGMNVGLNLVFVPVYGFRAAAFATLAAFVLLSLITPLLARNWLTWTIPLWHLLRLGVCLALQAAAMAGVGFLIEPGLFRLAGQSLAGGGAYAAGLLLSGEVPIRTLIRFWPGPRPKPQ